MKVSMSLPCLLVSVALLSASPVVTSARNQSLDSLPPGDDAIVTRVVSGDTIEVKIQGIGFTIGYLGVDAPNPATKDAKAECYSREATALNTQLVRGETVRVEREATDFEPNGSGRLMRYVYLKDGRMVNEELTKAGAARVSNALPDRRYRDRLVAAEREAQESVRGLWKACGTAQVPEPASSQSSATCVEVDYVALRHELRQKQQRPQILNALPVGACVTLTMPQGHVGQFTWQPAGSRIRLDRSLYSFWRDGFVTVLVRDGKIAIPTVIMSERVTGPFTSMDGTVRPEIRTKSPIYTERELERTGDRNQILALPGGRSFIYEDVGNGDVIALIDTLQLDSGSLFTTYHTMP